MAPPSRSLNANAPAAVRSRARGVIPHANPSRAVGPWAFDSHPVRVESESHADLSGLNRLIDDDALRAEIRQLIATLDHLSPLNQVSVSGAKIKLVLGAMEVGKIPGLQLLNGLPLNQTVGGIGTVMNDTWSSKAPLLAERGIETVAVTPLMGSMSKEKMKCIGTVRVWLENEPTDVRAYEYRLPNAGSVVFVEHALLSRHFCAMPQASTNIYEMRAIDPGAEGELQKQRIWSLLSQAVAGVYNLIEGDIFVPQDGHMAPASFYIFRSSKRYLSLAPLIHNERYLDNFYIAPGAQPRTAAIWNVSESDLREFFMHGDHLALLAPAVRTAERAGVFTGKSVADNTADILNKNGLPPEAYPPIDLFSRLAAEQNFLSHEHRPDRNPFLGRTTPEALVADGIDDEETIQAYSGPHGFQFGGPLETHGLGVVVGKARAKRAIQRMLGLDRGLDRPLFVSFARMVQQKGMDFIFPNVMRILKRGGQIVVGGPVGDSSGAAAQRAFRELKVTLDQIAPELSRNFILIDGPIAGRMKALLLAAHDFFLLPSRYEPCGLTDIESIYNGGIPIAPRLGGLVKGLATIKYAVRNPYDQAAALGGAIDEAFDFFEADRSQFLSAQVSAHAENFSVEQHVDQFLKNLRVEVFYKIQRALATIPQSRQTDDTAAKEILRRLVELRPLSDRAAFAEALKRIHSDRRQALVQWTIDLLSESAKT